MYILGLGGSLHDFSACIVQDKKILVAIEEERITRQKHGVDKNLLQECIMNNQVWKYTKEMDPMTLQKAVQYCLNYTNISLDDVDVVATTDSNIYIPYVNSFENLIVMRHHLAHAASAYYTSEYDKSAILVVDGRGSLITHKGETGYETVTFAVGEGNKIKIIDHVLKHSLGHFYEDFVLALGFKLLEEGKVMGLSSYGTDKYVKEFRNLFELLPEGQVRFLNSDSEIRNAIRDIVVQNNDDFQTKADLAYAVQKYTEEIMMHFVKHLRDVTNCKYLCLSGGVALNSVANGVIYNSNLFDHMHVFPAAGDNGLSIGAALYTANLTS